MREFRSLHQMTSSKKIGHRQNPTVDNRDQKMRVDHQNISKHMTTDQQSNSYGTIAGRPQTLVLPQLDPFFVCSVKKTRNDPTGLVEYRMILYRGWKSFALTKN